jgi:uncharacterized protein (TIGR02271 family)
MSSGMTAGSSAHRMVTAFFDSRSDAEEAISRLHTAGIPRDGIRLTSSGERDNSRSGSTGTKSVGDASIGLWESLRDLFLPDEDRHTYAEGLSRGGYLVAVQTSDADYERVIDILDDEGTIDIDERASSWRAEGWSGSSGLASPSGGTADLTTGTAGTASTTATTGSGLGTSSTDISSDRTTRGDEVIPIAEERLAVGKRDVSHGRVRIRSYVVETPVSEQVNLRQEHVEVERRPADRTISGAEDAFRERTIEMEEHSEEAIVSKEARVKEELVVRKDVEQRTETISDTVRSTEVEVEDERGNTVTTTGTRDPS